MRDGRELSKLVKYPRGHAHQPLRDEDVIAKFKRQATGVVSEGTAARLVEQALSLERLADVTPLLEFETR